MSEIQMNANLRNLLNEFQYEHFEDDINRVIAEATKEDKASIKATLARIQRKTMIKWRGRKVYKRLKRRCIALRSPIQRPYRTK